MISTTLMTFAAGALYLIAGLCGLIRHFLLEPRLVIIPRTPRWLLRIFFGFSTVMIYVGLKFIAVWAEGLATQSPPGVTGLGVLIAFTIFTYKSSLLYDTLTRKSSMTMDELVQRFKEL